MRNDLFSIPLPAIHIHQTKARVIAGCHVQPAQNKGHARAIGYIIGRLFKAKRHQYLLAQQIGYRTLCGAPNDHADHMGIDRYILPNRPGRVFPFLDPGSKIIQRATQRNNAAHFVDVGIEIQIILVEFHPAGHVQNIANGRALIGGPFQVRGVFHHLFVKRADFALGHQNSHQIRQIAFGDRPGNAQIIFAGAQKILFGDDFAVLQNHQRGHAAFLDPVIQPLDCGGRITDWQFRSLPRANA